MTTPARNARQTSRRCEFPNRRCRSVSKCAATAPSEDGAADSSPSAVLHLAREADAPSTFCVEGPSTGAALASANTAALLPDVSAGNTSTGTNFVSAGATAVSSWRCRPFNRCCLGSNESSCNREERRSYKCQHCSPGSECCPSYPCHQRCRLFKKLQCR